MPVLSETASYGIAMFPDINITYVVLGAIVLVLLGSYMTRKTKSSQPLETGFPQEKGALMDRQESGHMIMKPQSADPISEAKSRIQRPIQPSPFTPPMRAQTDPVFSSFEAYEQAMGVLPRRRSYTKTLEDGTEVNGEVIVAEGWRRHTKVFGGGVCQACEENERRLSA